MQIRTDSPHLTDWDDLRFFLATMRGGSFVAAAQALGTNPSTVGRRIEQLETRLGAKLFDRIGRGMTPTPAAHDLLGPAMAMEGAAQTAAQALMGRDREMVGTVTIASPEGLAAYCVAPWMAEFRTIHPDIAIRIPVSNKVVDLRTRIADIALQVADPTDPRAVGVKVGVLCFRPFASESYLAQRGIPADLEALSPHRVIDHSGYWPLLGLEQWQTLVTSHPHVVFTTDSHRVYLEAVRAGYGIGLLPTYYARRVPELRELSLPLAADLPIWLVSHSETNGPARIQAVFRFLRERFAAERGRWFS